MSAQGTYTPPGGGGGGWVGLALGQTNMPRDFIFLLNPSLIYLPFYFYDILKVIFYIICCSVSVSEDYSRKTRFARDKLRKFGRDVRKENPEKKIQMK